MIESELSRWKLHPSGHGLTAKRSESFEERESGAGVGYLLPLLLKKVREKEGKREGDTSLSVLDLHTMDCSPSPL